VGEAARGRGQWGRLLEEGAIEELETVQRTLAEIESMLAAVKTAMCNRIHAVKRQLSAALAQVDEMVQCRLETDPTEETEEALAEIGWDSRKEEYGEIERKYRQVQDERIMLKTLLTNDDCLKSINRFSTSNFILNKTSRLIFAENSLARIIKCLGISEKRFSTFKPSIEAITTSLQIVLNSTRELTKQFPSISTPHLSLFTSSKYHNSFLSSTSQNLFEPSPTPQPQQSLFQSTTPQTTSLFFPSKTPQPTQISSNLTT